MGEVIHISHMVKALKNPPNRIREQRKARAISSTRLAAMLDTASHVITRFETGERPIDFPWLKRIAHALDCTVGDLLNAEDNPLAAQTESEAEVIRTMRLDDRAADTIARVAEVQRSFAPQPEEEEPRRRA